MKNIRKKFWRLLYATICTVLFLRTEYLRGEIPIPAEDGIFIQIFGYFIVMPFFIIIAWFWDNKRLYHAFTEEYSKPISYQTYLTIGTVFLFILMLFFITTSFIFPVPTTYHYGR